MLGLSLCSALESGREGPTPRAATLYSVTGHSCPVQEEEDSLVNGVFAAAFPLSKSSGPICSLKAEHALHFHLQCS